MPIIYRTGDIFESGCDALVNPVNCVGVMGAGVALEFKKRYPLYFKAYCNACHAGIVTPGRVFLVLGMDRQIFTFPTKRHWKDKSLLVDIENGLMDLRQHLLNTEGHINTVAVPALGCGNGGLKWEDVKKLMELHLGDLAQDIYLFEPDFLMI